VTDLAREILRMLKAPPTKFRHHPTLKTKLFMAALLGLFILLGVVLRLVL
jgi:hypothetical protein